MPYRGTRSQRRTLFYKYLPFGASRADLSGIKKRHYDLTAPEMTDAQRLIMGWPEEWGGEEGQLTGAGLMFEPPKL